MDGKGGILLSELNDCVANAEAIAKSLGNQIIAVPTQVKINKFLKWEINQILKIFKWEKLSIFMFENKIFTNQKENAHQEGFELSTLFLLDNGVEISQK